MNWKNQKNQYFPIAVFSLGVVLIAICFFFAMSHMDAIMQFFARLNLILRPIYTGIIFAFVLLPVNRRIFDFLRQMTKGKKLGASKYISLLNAISVAASILIALFILYLLLAMLLPQIYFSVVGLLEALPTYFRTIQTWISGFFENNPEIQATVVGYYDSVVLSLEDWINAELLPNLESVTSAVRWFKGEVFPGLTGVVSNVYTGVMAIFSFILDFFVGVIVSVYLLIRKDVFAAQTKKLTFALLPTKVADSVIEEVRKVYRILSGFINGKLLDSLIIGIICFVFCVCFNMPYSPLIATIVGVTNIIPFFGPFIGAVPSTLLILLVNPVQCLYFIIFIIILQQFDGNILGPKILGESTGLASFWVLFSIILFGGLFGVPGMIFGVPIFAVIYSFVSRFVRRKLRRRGLPYSTDFYVGKTKRMAKDYHPDVLDLIEDEIEF